MSFTDPDAQRVDEAAESEGIRALRERLDQEAAERQRLDGENAQLRKESAFLNAKLPDTPQVKFFQENYQGDMTSDAIRAAAESYGFIAAPGPTADQQAQVDLIHETVSGAPGPVNPGTHQAILDELGKVPTSQNSTEIIESILKKYGHPVAADFD
jgi:hypothetical protein